MSFRDHTAHIIMHAAGQDRAQNDPQKYHRPEARSHQRAEDRPGTRDIQQLHQEFLPGRKRDKVHAVLFRKCGGFPVVRVKYTLNDPPVYKISQEQYHK